MSFLNGRNQTPKHIGLGIAVHQATHSKELVELLHSAGHTISYESIRRVDTSIANNVLARFENKGVVIPSNFNTAVCCRVTFGMPMTILILTRKLWMEKELSMHHKQLHFDEGN